MAAVSNFFYNHGANITSLDQYSTDPEGGTFFMRLEFQTPHLDLSRPLLERTFGEAVALPSVTTSSGSHACKRTAPNTTIAASGAEFVRFICPTLVFSFGVRG